MKSKMKRQRKMKMRVKMIQSKKIMLMLMITKHQIENSLLSSIQVKQESDLKINLS